MPCLDRSRVASLARISSWVNLFHIITATWTTRGLRPLLIHHHEMIWLDLELVLLVERVLPYLLILRVEAIEVIVSLMEKVNHAWSHAVCTLVASGTLIQHLTAIVLGNELLDVALALARHTSFAPSRNTRELVTQHGSLAKAVRLIVATSLGPCIIQTQSLVWLLLPAWWPLPLLVLVPKQVGCGTRVQIIELARMCCRIIASSVLVQGQRLSRLRVLHLVHVRQ